MGDDMEGAGEAASNKDFANEIRMKMALMDAFTEVARELRIVLPTMTLAISAIDALRKLSPTAAPIDQAQGVRDG